MCEARPKDRREGKNKHGTLFIKSAAKNAILGTMGKLLDH